MTTYQPPPAGNGTILTAWLAAVLRDIAIIAAVAIYATDTL